MQNNAGSTGLTAVRWYDQDKPAMRLGAMVANYYIRPATDGTPLSGSTGKNKTRIPADLDGALWAGTNHPRRCWRKLSSG
jgi:hypothetical protein